MSQAQNTIVANVATNAADTAVGRRAIEAAKFANASSANAGRRFVNIALHIANAIEQAGAKSGDKLRIRYESINSATGQKRGAGAGITEKAKIGVWRTGIAQARQYAPEVMAIAGAVDYDATGMHITVA